MDKNLFRTRLLEVLDSGWTVASLTSKADIKYDIVRDMKRRPNASTSVENAEKIASALGKTLDEFLYGQDRNTEAKALSSKLDRLTPENLARVAERVNVLLEQQSADQEGE